MLISPAFATDAAGAAAQTTGSSFVASLIPLLMVFLIFYFFVIRPQQKRLREHQSMLGAVQKGDRIVTSGGIIGTVYKVEEAEITLEVADNVRLRIQRGAIAEVLARTGAIANNNKA